MSALSEMFGIKPNSYAQNQQQSGFFGQGQGSGLGGALQQGLLGSEGIIIQDWQQQQIQAEAQRAKEKYMAMMQQEMAMRPPATVVRHVRIQFVWGESYDAD